MEKLLRTITAIERDGFNVRTLTMVFEVPAKDFDLKAAVMAAATEYCKTKEGRETYSHNCGNFNWADLEMNVPNEICERHGFRMVDTMLSDIEVDWDEQLVDASKIPNDDNDEEE